VAERKPFLLRLEPATLAALQRWAADDLRSLNGQIEFLLRHALQDAGRAAPATPPHPPSPGRHTATGGRRPRGKDPGQ
jgi:hypothetical protein